MGDKLAWVPFYTDDFAGSRDVRNMSRTEVGAYIDVLCILWGSGGYALDTAGQAMSVEALAHEICRKGEPLTDVLTAVQSLLAKGALKQDAKGIFNPKAVEVCKRKEEKSEKARESISRRWRRPESDSQIPTGYERNTNVSETNLRTGYEGDTTHSSELRAHNSELITQSSEPGKKTHELSDLPSDAPPVEVIEAELVTDSPDKVPVAAIVEAYHSACCPPMPRVAKLTERRRAYIRARWHEASERQSVDWWQGYFEHCADSAFLRGEGEGRDGRPPFIADLEWLVRPENMVKALEGKYHRQARPEDMLNRTQKINLATARWAKEHGL